MMTKTTITTIQGTLLVFKNPLVLHSFGTRVSVNSTPLHSFRKSSSHNFSILKQQQQQCRFISTSVPPNTPSDNSLPTSIPSIPTQQQLPPTEGVDLPPLLNSYGDPLLEIVGPLSFTEVILNNLHSLTGLPWYAVIASISVLIRVVFMPLYYRARKNEVEWQSATPDLAVFFEIRDKAFKLGHTKELRKAEEGIDLFVKQWNNAGMFKHFFKRLAPLPFVLGLSVVLRDMAAITPSFKTGGVSFCPDLSLSVFTIDNYMAYSMPFISVIPSLLYNEYRWHQVKKSIPPGESIPKAVRYITYFLRTVYIGAIPLTMYMPVGIFFAWIPGNILAILITLLFETRPLTLRILNEIREDLKRSGVKIKEDESVK